MEGKWRFKDLPEKGSQEATIISSVALPEDVLAAVGESAFRPPVPSQQNVEAAIRKLLQESAPLRPTPDTVLPIDGQTYLAYNLATTHDVHECMRSWAIHAIVNRLVAACQAITLQEKPVAPSAKRGAGAWLIFFASRHVDELRGETFRAAIAADPVRLLAEGLCETDSIGSGVGITGAAVRPSFLKHALQFAQDYAPALLPSLMQAFRHAQSVALPADRAAWRELCEQA